MAADDLATQGAKASAAILLTEISWNIPVSAPAKLRNTDGSISSATVAPVGEGILCPRNHTVKFYVRWLFVLKTLLSI